MPKPLHDWLIFLSFVALIAANIYIYGILIVFMLTGDRSVLPH